MIKITTIFGEDAVREYEENNELPSEEWLADNGASWTRKSSRLRRSTMPTSPG